MVSTAEQKSQALDVSSLIDERPMSGFQVWTVILGGLVLVLDGFDGQTINYLTPSIAETTKIPVHSFGPILSASLIGLMVAALTTGPLADRWGRKWPVIFSTLSFALFSLLTARANTRSEFWILRFLTGLGLGGAMPNVVALSSEYIPKRLLAVVIPILFVGMPLGGTISGFTSAAMIPVWGWRSVFLVGGIVPLVIAMALMIVLPESIQFLAVQGKSPERIAKILVRISPKLARSGVSVVDFDRKRARGVPVKYLFADGRTAGTVLLWIPYFMNLLLIYFLSGWLPALLRDEGMSVSGGVAATALISFGGVFGCLVEGLLLRRWGASQVLVTEYAMAGLLIASLALIPVSFPVMLVMTFSTGLTIIGAQGGLNALAARFYPVSVRSTGVGWALGVGRIGSILGPLLGGVFLSIGWRTRDMLLFAAAVAVIAFASILVSNQIRTVTAYTRGPDLGGDR
ncbi:MAG TPA: MFS transporter [Candidatus Acidoferrales bacterium]|nr:MFS transporter [Candidatus Acidoferrales bacterium]